MKKGIQEKTHTQAQTHIFSAFTVTNKVTNAVYIQERETQQIEGRKRKNELLIVFIKFIS